jgi:superfamily II DNA/RNA helicase
VNFEQLSLDRRIVAAIKTVGYTTLTPIQQQAIPILHQLTQGPLRHVRALIVAPTRELAEQIYEVCVNLGRNTKVSCVIWRVLC